MTETPLRSVTNSITWMLILAPTYSTKIFIGRTVMTTYVIPFVHRFSEGAQLRDVCWLEIRGKINSKMLSQDTTYAAYMEASVSSGATNLTRKVCIQDEGEDGDEDNEEDVVLENYWARWNNRVVSHRENVTLPQKRADGWMELELGKFFNEGGDDGEVSFSLTETKGGQWKRGLIVQGIEIRRKKGGQWKLTDVPFPYF
uniref:Uncharacterized protein n=1 Tax=Aegilops tauschii TaxID=37682 RepID=M8BME2_AEGTA